jgi:hypothetical protein
MAGAIKEAVIDDVNEADHIETEEDSFAEGIIKGLHDFKEGRITRFKNVEEMADHLRKL